jgi:hypothetical protein
MEPIADDALIISTTERHGGGNENKRRMAIQSILNDADEVAVTENYGADEMLAGRGNRRYCEGSMLNHRSTSSNCNSKTGFFPTIYL